ncbi:hypothetical protein [Streptomyces sp. NPDC060333]|uniref:hypothetical protein n=1 Tax=Streptomyces sp. NPDC060333 TaxID=3347098 RepID=UPI003667B550
MGNRRLVVVHPPDEEGARQATIGMARKVVRSREELAGFLRENELSDDVNDPNLIEWRGGGSRTWGKSSTGPSDSASWSRWATATLMANGLLTAGVLFAIIGARDAWEALTYVGRIASASFFAISFITLTAAVTVAADYLLRRRLKFSAAVNLLAVLTVLAANLLLLFIQGVGREYTHWFVLWLGLTLWSGWALWELLHRQRVWGKIPQRKKFAAALSISALIAVANFSYAQIYKPYAAPIVITNSVKFGTPLLAPGGHTIRIPLTLHFENSGEWPAYIIAASYEVIGLKGGHARQDPRAVETWRQDIQQEKMDLNAYADPRTSIPQPIIHELIVQPAYVYMEPGDAFTEERVIEIPAKNFNVIQAHSKVIAMRMDRASMTGEPGDWKEYSWRKGKAPSWVMEKAEAPNDSDYVEYHIPLKYSNEILNLTRNTRYLTLWWVLGKNKEYVFKLVDNVALDGEERIKRKTSERLRDRDRYGVVNIDSGFAQVFVAAQR